MFTGMNPEGTGQGGTPRAGCAAASPCPGVGSSPHSAACWEAAAIQRSPSVAVRMPGLAILQAEHLCSCAPCCTGQLTPLVPSSIPVFTCALGCSLTVFLSTSLHPCLISLLLPHSLFFFDCILGAAVSSPRASLRTLFIHTYLFTHAARKPEHGAGRGSGGWKDTVTQRPVGDI